MNRTVRQTNVSPDRPEDARPRLFSEFADEPNLVLLGDPGAGKTHLFQEAAAVNGARLMKARTFLVTPAHALSGQTVFVDGLDEKRSGRGDRDTVDSIVEKLFQANPAKVRISCRAADWLGDSDLASLRPYFEQTGEPLVLVLEKLSREEQRAVLAAQGLAAEAAEEFLCEAESRGLDDFPENPQNLIMLWRAVQTGSWPASRKELFELATTLMLQEADPDRARSGAGVYSVSELRPAAGAICAARLISDADAVSLTEQEGTLEIPGYRSLSFIAPELVQAALGRRVFVAASESESVDYAHRTTAEFLAAGFLADRIRAGLPLGRVIALIGVDGHPAPELRGLHAWLAVHLREHADLLIEADPYGVLTYGDALSLSPSSCACLVRALGNLSRANPWFRSENWQSRSIGALARADMVGEFRAVLSDPEAGFGIRSIIVDALSMGTPIPEMVPDLAETLAREASPYTERYHALLALLRHGDAGRQAVIDAFGAGLGSMVNGLRLRSEIIQRLYGDPFGSADVVELVNDALVTTDALGTGILWTLADNLPLEELPEILDGVNAPQREEAGYDRRNREVGSFYGRVLIRAWGADRAFDAGRALGWLRKRMAFKGGPNESRARNLRAAMREHPDRVRAVADHFLANVQPDDNRWLALHRFREAILFGLSTEDLLDMVVACMEAAVLGSPRQLFLYEAAFGLVYNAEHARGVAIFDRLYGLAELQPFLRSARDGWAVRRLPDGYPGTLSHQPHEEDSRERQRQDFDQDAAQIRSGAHLGWITHLARIYFALYSDVDRATAPRDRLSAWLGEERVETALAGLRAAPSRPDIPSFADVMEMTADHQLYDWWHALVAGLNERWANGEGLAGQSEDFLTGLVAFDLANPVWSEQDGIERCLVHPWKQALVEQRPALVRDAYLAVARLRLSRGDQYVEGLHELLTEATLEPYRRDVALQLARDFPNAPALQLKGMLDAVIKLPAAHAEFLVLAREVLRRAVAVDEIQRDLWLVSAYVIAPAQYEAEVESRAHARPALVFDLRDRCGFAFRGQPEDSALPLPSLEFVARLTGTAYPETPHPARGWSGDTNAWDAAEHCRALIGRISAIPSEAATNALRRLEASRDLASYRPHLLQAIANQRQRRRDAEYDRPDWPRTVRALANGPPATVADLHAVLVEHLLDRRVHIQRNNADIYKQFWNVDRYARPKTPRPEETCRDALVTLMRPGLSPLGITVEPEGHMVADNRADISVAMPLRKILNELKRDYHADVWTAAERQLERCYAHDPESQGFGVYVVFWFGGKRTSGIPKPPGDMKRPGTAAEMERMLRDLVPLDRRSRTAVIVIDVSGQSAAVGDPSRLYKTAKKKKSAKKPRASAKPKLPRNKKAEAAKSQKGAKGRAEKTKNRSAEGAKKRPKKTKKSSRR